MCWTLDSSFQSSNTLNNTGVWSLIELASLYTVPLSAVNGLSRLTTTSNGQAQPIRKVSNRPMTFELNRNGRIELNLEASQVPNTDSKFQVQTLSPTEDNGGWRQVVYHTVNTVSMPKQKTMVDGDKLSKSTIQSTQCQCRNVCQLDSKRSCAQNGILEICQRIIPIGALQQNATTNATSVSD